MRILLINTILSLNLVRMCGDDEEDAAPPEVATPPATVAVEGEAVAPVATVTADIQPAHGGTVVIAEDHAVEVVTQPSGEIRAYVVHVEAPSPPPPPEVIIVEVPTHGGARQSVDLRYDVELGAFHGQLVRARPVAGELFVRFEVGGHLRHGHVAEYVIVSGPVMHAELENPGPTVVVERPRRPNVDVHIHAPAPPPPPHVDIHIGVPRPRPPQVVIGVHPPPPPRVVVRAPSPRVEVRGNVVVRGGNMRGHIIGRGHRMHGH